MSVYYLNTVAIQKSKDQPINKAIASAFDATLHDSRTNQIYNSLNKHNGLLHKETMLPFQTQHMIGNRSKLWDYSERNKKRKYSRFAKKRSGKSAYEAKGIVMQSIYWFTFNKGRNYF